MIFRSSARGWGGGGPYLLCCPKSLHSNGLACLHATPCVSVVLRTHAHAQARRVPLRVQQDPPKTGTGLACIRAREFPPACACAREEELAPAPARAAWPPTTPERTNVVHNRHKRTMGAPSFGVPRFDGRCPVKSYAGLDSGTVTAVLSRVGRHVWETTDSLNCGEANYDYRFPCNCRLAQGSCAQGAQDGDRVLDYYHCGRLERSERVNYGSERRSQNDRRTAPITRASGTGRGPCGKAGPSAVDSTRRVRAALGYVPGGRGLLRAQGNGRPVTRRRALWDQ